MSSLFNSCLPCLTGPDPEQKEIKLVLLGTGESGKSTITKQMKIIHSDGFSLEEKREKIPAIRKNLSDSILTILGAMSTTNLSIGLELPENLELVDYIRENATKEDFDYPQEFFENVAILWKDGGVQACYERANEYQLIDCAKYFLDKASEIGHPDYLPTSQDLLRNRVLTSSIKEMSFQVERYTFRMCDVGGQRVQRQQWIQIINDITAVLFVLDCSCFDTVLREDPSRNRLLDAIQTLEKVWNSKFMPDDSMLLFINKIDVLEEKISKGKSLDSLVESLSEDEPYKEYFHNWFSWDGPNIKEEEKFVEEYPALQANDRRMTYQRESTDDQEILERPSFTNLRTPRPTRLQQKVAQLREEKNISQQTIDTAVFIKRLIMKLLQKMPSGKYREKPLKWEDKDGPKCYYYYTCAVDTKTITNIFHGCRNIAIAELLRKFGLI